MQATGVSVRLAPLPELNDALDEAQIAAQADGRLLPDPDDDEPRPATPTKSTP